MKTVFYRKEGRKYIPVGEYDEKLLDRFPYGATLVVVQEGTHSRRYKIDPNYAALIAAGTVAEDVISRAIVKASEARPMRNPITEEQRAAWKYFADSFGDELGTIVYPSAREAAEEAVKVMREEANKLMQHEAVKKAFDHFLLVCKMVENNAQ